MPNFRLSAYCWHSLRVNCFRCTLWVTRLCKPPWFLITLFIIQLVALPQIIRSTSFRPLAHPFQKYSRAGINSERFVSIQGISSIKMTFFVSVELRIRSFNISNASIQFLGVAPTLYPASANEDFQAKSCFRIVDFAKPACWKVKL